jgi:hypothetical protein
LTAHVRSRCARCSLYKATGGDAKFVKLCELLPYAAHTMETGMMCVSVPRLPRLVRSCFRCARTAYRQAAACHHPSSRLRTTAMWWCGSVADDRGNCARLLPQFPAEQPHGRGRAGAGARAAADDPGGVHLVRASSSPALWCIVRAPPPAKRRCRRIRLFRYQDQDGGRRSLRGSSTAVCLQD